jgi:hypothetical protein
MEGKWKWYDVNEALEQLDCTDREGRVRHPADCDNRLEVALVCPRIVDPYQQPTLLLVGTNESGRYVWWAIVNGDCMTMYTGSGRFNRFGGRGDDDLEPAIDDAELCLRRLGFRQNR